MNTIKIEHGNTLMVAHRGCSGLEKENTCAAFVAAGSRSYWGIETDIHPTLDGKIVCIHDGNTKRVAQDNVEVESSTFDTLRSIVLNDIDNKKGRNDLRIPTLQEYVQLCKKYDKIGVCEIKHLFHRADLQKVVDIIKAEDYMQGIVFIAFDIDNLITLREMLPEQTMQFLTAHVDDEMIALLNKYRLDLDIHHSGLTKEGLDLCHANGIKVNVWTVDDPARAAELVSWGADYITSNILE